MRQAIRFPARALALSGALATATWPLVPMAAFAGEEPVSPGPVFVPKLTVDAGPVFVPPPKAVETTDTGEPTADTAARIVAGLNLARDYCGWLEDKDYVIDCLSDELNRVADSIPGDGTYGPAKAALKEAAAELSSLVAANESTTKRPGIARLTNSDEVRSSTRPLRAVETEKRAELSAAAIGIIEETGTILLRSAATSDEAAGFTAISAAVNSSTILLRSL